MLDEPIFLGVDRDNPPARSDAVQNRAIILDTARRLFEEYGVEHVSMSQITREANVGKGTVYRHFRNKSDLCHALLDNEQRVLQDRVFAYLRATPDTPCNLLIWFLQELGNFTQKNISLLYEATQENFKIGLDHPAHHWQWLTIVGLLRQLDTNVDVEYMADVLYALVDPRLYHLQRVIRGYTHERIMEGIFHVAQLLLT